MGGTIALTYDNRFDTAATEVAPLGAGTSTLTTTYDAAGRRTQIQVTGSTAVTYDAVSCRTQAMLPNSVTIDYAYDNASQFVPECNRRPRSSSSV